jgi:hypothetical protein
MDNPGEHRVTADPNTPLHGIPGSLGAKLPSAERSGSPAAALPAGLQVGEGNRPTAAELWLHRLSVLLFVFVCASVGVLLVILPWRPEWTDNHLLLARPWLRELVANGFVRGLCSGLGALDIWIGFWEAVHYHEGPRA